MKWLWKMALTFLVVLTALAMSSRIIKTAMGDDNYDGEGDEAAFVTTLIAQLHHIVKAIWSSKSIYGAFKRMSRFFPDTEWEKEQYAKMEAHSTTPIIIWYELSFIEMEKKIKEIIKVKLKQLNLVFSCFLCEIVVQN